MKKTFFVLMMVASIATLFTGCKKENSDDVTPIPPPVYSNQFTIGDNTYDIVFAGKMNGISVIPGINLNVVAFASAPLESEHNNLYCVIYDGEITNGTISVAPDSTSMIPMPKVVAIQDVNLVQVLSDISNVLYDGIAMGIGGNLTLNEENGTYTVTTENMTLSLNNSIVNGSIEYQGTVSDISFANGGNFTIDGHEHTILTAGVMDMTYYGTAMRVMAFVSTTTTDIIAVKIENEIETGSFQIPLDKAVFMIRNFDMSTYNGDISVATSGTLTVSDAGMSMYQVTINDASFVSLNGSSVVNLNYKGYIPELSLRFE